MEMGRRGEILGLELELEVGSGMGTSGMEERGGKVGLQEGWEE